MKRDPKAGSHKTPAAPPPAAPVPAPFKPRKKLFVGLLMGYALWLGVLIVLYVLTHRST